MKFFVYTDGASRGNPGKSASGYAIYDDKFNLVKEYVFYNGIATNNVAEYKAIIAALKEAIKLGADEIVLFSDSKLAISQLQGKYKIKSANLKQLNNEAKGLLLSLKSYKLENPRRENAYISSVDKMLNRFLDSLEKKSDG
ncbi:MAG: ribonuclease HI family protein [Candidatus Micrarchaeia archaeon]